ncbi:apoptosis-stimulating of p53 protein 2a isoform X1 [Tachysurus ichikawai]
MFLTVYLSNNDQHFTEVPITPETTCRDVVELCKEPGEMDCHLSEMWRGSGSGSRFSFSVACRHGYTSFKHARLGVFSSSAQKDLGTSVLISTDLHHTDRKPFFESRSAARFTF